MVQTLRYIQSLKNFDEGDRKAAEIISKISIFVKFSAVWIFSKKRAAKQKKACWHHASAANSAPYIFGAKMFLQEKHVNFSENWNFDEFWEKWTLFREV